jgi:prepilin-type N-terminal cleavage/methylation domain-containing protein
MQRRRGFSLVELLIVIGIIGLLVGIAFPVVSKLRESSNRVVCTSNLRNLGVAANLFAEQYDKALPVSYMLPKSGYPFRFPSVVSRNAALDNAARSWRTYGTPTSMWERFGMATGNWTCPSASYGDVKEHGDADGTPLEWGPILWTHYMYLGGMWAGNRGKSAARWGAAEPAVVSNDPAAATKVLAADMVFYSGGDPYEWDRVRMRYMINHRGKRNQPGFQNLLYADGHVEGKGPDFYPEALNGIYNYSFQHETTTVGGYFFWGPAQAAPVPDPPPQPKAPTYPSPSAPKPPVVTPPPPPPVTPPTPPPPPVKPRPIPE